MSLTMPAAQRLDACTGDWSLATRATQTYQTARTFVTLGGLAVTIAGGLLPVWRIEAER
jgi:hypothetical protein